MGVTSQQSNTTQQPGNQETGEGNTCESRKMNSVLMEQANLELGLVNTGSLLTLLECPVCLDHITPPIKQCVKGHLVCSDCFPRLPHCPTCRSPMSEERNLGMEQVARLLKFPCRYHPMGCTESYSLSQKEEHERNCPYLQLKCPFHGQCSFGGSLSAVVPHLKAEHSVTPVPVQPSGTLFYRAKFFFKRNLWNFIFLGRQPVQVHGETRPLVHRGQARELQPSYCTHSVHW